MRTIINIDQILNALKDHLNLNMSWKTIASNNNSWDHFISLKIAANQVKVPVETKRELRNIHLTQLQDLKNTDENYLVLANIIDQPLRNKLRQLQINFVDGCGNASINIGNIHIQVDGLKGSRASENIRTFRASHLKLIWYLLQKEDSINKTYRSIASETNLSLDTISKTMNALEKQNYLIRLNEDRFKPTKKTELLEKWLMGYEDTLRPKLAKGTYRFVDKKPGEAWQDIKLDTKKTLWGGEPAAAKLTRYLNPQIYTIYTNQSESELLRQYRMVPDKKGNIEVYQLFFKPEIYVTGDLVPPLLIYADLQISGEERNLETARMIYEEYIANTL